MSHEDYLRRAIALARDNVQTGFGGPFGAVIVQQETIIAEGTNKVLGLNDPTAHAEIGAIREACRKLGNFRLSGCRIYSSCEPCPMCLSAIYWARLDSLWYAASRDDAARAGFDDSLLYQQIPMAVQERLLPSHRLLEGEGNTPFEHWRRYEARIPY